MPWINKSEAKEGDIVEYKALGLFYILYIRCACVAHYTKVLKCNRMTGKMYIRDGISIGIKMTTHERHIIQRIRDIMITHSRNGWPSIWSQSFMSNRLTSRKLRAPRTCPAWFSRKRMQTARIVARVVSCSYKLILYFKPLSIQRFFKYFLKNSFNWNISIHSHLTLKGNKGNLKEM